MVASACGKFILSIMPEMSKTEALERRLPFLEFLTMLSRLMLPTPRPFSPPSSSSSLEEERAVLASFSTQVPASGELPSSSSSPAVSRMASVSDFCVFPLAVPFPAVLFERAAGFCTAGALRAVSSSGSAASMLSNSASLTASGFITTPPLTDGAIEVLAGAVGFFLAAVIFGAGSNNIASISSARALQTKKIEKTAR